MQGCWGVGCASWKRAALPPAEGDQNWGEAPSAQLLQSVYHILSYFSAVLGYLKNAATASGLHLALPTPCSKTTAVCLQEHLCLKDASWKYLTSFTKPAVGRDLLQKRWLWGGSIQLMQLQWFGCLELSESFFPFFLSRSPPGPLQQYVLFNVFYYSQFIRLYALSTRFNKETNY